MGRKFSMTNSQFPINFQGLSFRTRSGIYTNKIWILNQVQNDSEAR